MVEESASPGKEEVLSYSARAIIEIPAGTNVKYEMDKSSGKLTVERIDGEPRRIDYLPYPSNYGMIPNTIQSKSEGGDGDPLDVLVLGPALDAGEEVSVRIIGVLKFLDGGEKDDKLIAVCPGNQFSELESLKGLEENFPGVTDILKIWFLNYKGQEEMQFMGMGDELEARTMLSELDTFSK